MGINELIDIIKTANKEVEDLLSNLNNDDKDEIILENLEELYYLIEPDIKDVSEYNLSLSIMFTLLLSKQTDKFDINDILTMKKL